MSCSSDSNAHTTSKIQIVSRQGSTTHWGKLYIHNNSSTRKHLLRPIPELYGVQTSAEITVFNLRTNYKMSFESHKRCVITRTNYAVFTINRSKKINSRFTEMIFLSNFIVMSLFEFGANKWEASKPNSWKPLTGKYGKLVNALDLYWTKYQ